MEMEATEQLYNVVWMGRVSCRRKILRRNLKREDAKTVVNSYPDSRNSIVMFEKSRTKFKTVVTV